MGRGLLISIAAALLLAVGLTLRITDSGLIWQSTKTTDKQSLLAEEAARSGITMTASRLTREFDTWRTGLPVTPFGGGAFVTAIRGPMTGPLQAYSAGVVEGVDAQMTAWIARLAEAPAALTVESDSATVTLATDTSISGRDHTIDGEGLGRSDDVHGVWMTDDDVRDAFDDALGMINRSRVRGIDGNADLHVGALPGEHAAMLAEALSAPTHPFSTSQSFAGQVFGSVDTPAIVVVNGNATFAGGGGVGLLVVRGGSFEASADFSWRGVVVVEKTGSTRFRLSDTAEIVGAAYVFHVGGTEDAVGDEDAFVAFGDAPTHAGFGTFVDAVAWPGLGTVTVTTEQSAPAGAIVDIPAEVTGSSLQAFLGRADLDGVDVGSAGMTTVNYTGPSVLPILDVRPALTAAGTTTRVTLALPAALPAQPLFLYVADLDWVPMTIVARDAGGAALSTTSWTKNRSVDLIMPDEGNRTQLLTAAAEAQLVPNTPLGADSEVIIDEIRIPDASAIASLELAWSTTSPDGDVAGLALATESIFAPKGKLTVTLTDDAAVRYSAVEIGRLARPLTSVRARSRIVTYDHLARTDVDRGTLRSAGSTQRSESYPYCLAGTTLSAASLMERLQKQLAGAAPGVCI